MASILKVDTIQDQSGNNIINENADTITIGASGDTINIVGTLQNGGTNFLQGITMADQWRLTADLTGDNNPISTNLERVDTTGQGTIGTGMTESSGNFTFPQTGLYYVESKLVFNSAVNLSAMSNRINIATDGSTYSLLSIGYSYVDTTSSARRYSSQTTSAFVNVTDTANIKVQFRNTGSTGATIMGNTSANYSTFNFIRLGDSV